MIYIIGGRGLTGSAIARYAERNMLDFQIIQRENKNEFLGTSCELLVYANGNAFKYKAMEDPYFDFQASLGSVAEYVHGIDFQCYIHLSTVDVYSDICSYDSTVEDAPVDVMNLTPYGYHKRLAEDYVRRYCDRYLIFRLPGLVGPGLKKNPAFDFMHHNKKVMISPDSQLNFIHTDVMAETIFSVYEKNITNEIFNLGSSNSVRIDDIANIVGFKSDYTEDARKKLQIYRVNCSKIQQFCAVSTSEEALTSYAQEMGILNVETSK